MTQLTDEARSDALLVSDGAATVGFTRASEPSGLRTVHVATADRVDDLAEVPGSPVWGIDAAGTQLLVEISGGVLRWTASGEIETEPDVDVVRAPPGVLAWCIREARVLHVALPGRTIAYSDAACDAEIASSGAAAWFDADVGTFVAWPEDPDGAVQLLGPSPFDWPEITWSADGFRLAIRQAFGPDGEQDPLWAYTRGDAGATLVSDGVDYESAAAERDSWLFTRWGGAELWRAGPDGVERLAENVCGWVHAAGRVAWSTDACDEQVQVHVMDLAVGETSAPFPARPGLSAAENGVLVVDGLPGAPGTAWLLDGLSEPQPVVEDVDGIFATDLGWVALRGAEPERALVGDGWATEPGDLGFVGLGAWHLVTVMHRDGAYRIDVVLLAR